MRQRSSNSRAATNALEHDVNIAEVAGATHRCGGVMERDLPHHQPVEQTPIAVRRCFTEGGGNACVCRLIQVATCSGVTARRSKPCANKPPSEFVGCPYDVGREKINKPGFC